MGLYHLILMQLVCSGPRTTAWKVLFYLAVNSVLSDNFWHPVFFACGLHYVSFILLEWNLHRKGCSETVSSSVLTVCYSYKSGGSQVRNESAGIVSLSSQDSPLYSNHMSWHHLLWIIDSKFWLIRALGGDGAAVGYWGAMEVPLCGRTAPDHDQGKSQDSGPCCWCIVSIWFTTLRREREGMRGVKLEFLHCMSHSSPV